MGIFQKKYELTDLIPNWSDQECLTEFLKFMSRVHMTTQFIQQDDGTITHQVLEMVCGNQMYSSAPRELAHPLQPIPLSTEEKAAAN